MGVTNCLHWWNRNGWGYFCPCGCSIDYKTEEQFTQYDIEQISGLSSAYAVRLYELLICWRSTGKTPVIELAEFRKRLGVLDDEYTRSDNFKKWIIENPIKQINEHTDITASYEQHKKGEWLQDSHSSLSRRSPNKPKLLQKRQKQPRMTQTRQNPLQSLRSQNTAWFCAN